MVGPLIATSLTPMRILYDIVHPADVHFFNHAMAAQRERGDQILVTSRAKDIAIPLLERLGIPHRVLTRQGRGAGGLFAELLARDWRLLAAARDFRPDILVANNSPCVAHVGQILMRPSLIFDDTEIHRFNQWLYYPFVTEVHSPNCYRLQLGSKQRRYPGYHPLAYLHPARFTPDRDGHSPTGTNGGPKRVLLRFIHRGAMHDLGGRGLNVADKRRLVEELAEVAEVRISSESLLPPDLDGHRLRVPLEQVHHFIASADLMVGESATMCAEAAVLGTPAIFIDPHSRGYIDEIETRYGLCVRYDPRQITQVVEKARAILAPERPRRAFAAAHVRLLSDNMDVAAYQMAQIDRLVRTRRPGD